MGKSLLENGFVDASAATAAALFAGSDGTFMLLQ